MIVYEGMKCFLTILLILLAPLSLYGATELSESDLSGVTTENSLNIQASNGAEGIRKSWLLHFSKPGTIDFLLNEEGGELEDSGEFSGTQAAQVLQDSFMSATDYTARVSVVDANDPMNAGMSRIEFPNGLRRMNEGPTTQQIWLGGLESRVHAGYMCDFYTNHIESYTFPSSKVFISTH